mgnify:CR=1 FL=1
MWETLQRRNFRYRFLMDLAYNFKRWGTTAPNYDGCLYQTVGKAAIWQAVGSAAGADCGYPDGLYKDDTQVQTGGVKTGNLSCSKLS